VRLGHAFIHRVAQPRILVGSGGADVSHRELTTVLTTTITTVRLADTSTYTTTELVPGHTIGLYLASIFRDARVWSAL